MTATLDLNDFGEFTDQLNRDLQKAPLKDALKRVAVLIAAATKSNFDKGQTPDGQTWKPLARARTLPKSRRKAVKQRRAKTGERDKVLRDKGFLMASLVAKGANESAEGQKGNIESIGPSRMIYGTNIEYAGFHQFGTKHIPPREFLGINEPLMKRIDEVIADAVVKALSGK